jgi:hypothetical protein
MLRISSFLGQEFCCGNDRLGSVGTLERTVSNSDSTRSKFIGRTLFQAAQPVVAKNGPTSLTAPTRHQRTVADSWHTPTSSASFILLTELNYGNERIKPGYILTWSCGLYPSEYDKLSLTYTC